MFLTDGYGSIIFNLLFDGGYEPTIIGNTMVSMIYMIVYQGYKVWTHSQIILGLPVLDMTMVKYYIMKDACPREIARGCPENLVPG